METTRPSTVGSSGMAMAWTGEERRMWTLEGFDGLPAALGGGRAGRCQECLGVSRSTGYACVTDGTLRAIKIRRRLVIPRYELFKILFQFRLPPPLSA